MTNNYNNINDAPGVHGVVIPDVLLHRVQKVDPQCPE